MTTTDQAREAARETDGKFGAQTHALPENGLGDLISPEDHARLWALLTDGEGRYDAIDPEEFESFGGYMDYDFNSTVDQVARSLAEGYEKRFVRDGYPQEGRLVFGLDANADGEVGGYTMSLSLPGGYYLSELRDMKSATDDRDAEGTDGVMAIASALDADYRRMRNHAIKKGMIVDPEKVGPNDNLEPITAGGVMKILNNANLREEDVSQLQLMFAEAMKKDKK